jgi:proliferating cell nuclear antigen
MINSDTDKILLIKTVQITPFRVLVAALKDIVEEVNMVLTPAGLKIVNMDTSHSIVVHLELFAQNFELFICNKPKIIIGVNMPHFSKVLNSIDNGEILSLYINEDEYNDGIVENLTAQFDNKQKSQVKIQKLKLIELGCKEMEIPPVTFSSVINLPSTDFQKIVRDLNSMGADVLEIRSLDNEIRFKSVCPYGSSETIRGESDEMVIVKKHNKIIQGFYPVKHLNYFVKCTNLCNTIELYIENDIPIIIKYNVASLGELKLGLAPIKMKHD